MSSGILQSKDEREKELNNMKKLIIKEKIKRQKDMRAMFSPDNFKTHKSNFLSMILYILYLLLFIIIIMMQADKKMLYSQNCVSTLIKNTTAFDITATTIFNAGMNSTTLPIPFQFSEISNGEFVVDWIAEVSNRYIFDSNPQIDGQNWIFGDPRMRITIRKYKQNSNCNSKTNTVIQNITANESFDLTSDLGSNEQTSILIDRYGNKFIYTSNGNKNTALDKGGYVINMYENQTNPANFIRSLYHNGTLDQSWAYAVFEFVYANRNVGSIVMNSIIFYNSPAGITKQGFNIYILKKFYNSPVDYFRACLEIIFCLIFFYYLYKIIKGWITIFCGFVKDFLEKQPQEMKRSKNWISRYLNINSSNIFQKGILSCVYQFFLHLIKCIIRTIYWIIASILKHSFSDLYILIDTVSAALTLMLIIMWIIIISRPQLEIDENGVCPNVFSTVYDSTEYIISYIQVYSVNNLLRSLALMKYFQFSSKLSMFTEIIRSAVFDIIFFGMMFFIVIFGYSLAGSILFGIENSVFCTIYNSIMTNFLYIVGAEIYEELETLNDIGKYIYGVSFLLVNLLLLNMFVAIIGSHYFEYYSDNSGIEEMSLPKLIVQIMFSEEIKQRQQGIITDSPNEKCFKKFAKKFKLWIIDYVLGNEFIDSKEEENAVALLSKNLLKDQYHPKNQVINPEILKFFDYSFDELQNEEVDYIRIQRMASNDQMDKITFWLSLLEYTIDAYMGENYFPFLNDHEAILDEPTHNASAAIDLKYEEDCMLNDKQITFVMMNMAERLNLWNNLTKTK